MMPQQIEIYIDKIVLHGTDKANAAGLKTALREQLTSLIVENGLPEAFLSQTDHGRLDGGQISIDTNQQPASVGLGIAQGIYQGINSVS